MGQQLGIVVLIDVAGAVEANDLRGNLWFVDNGGWDGSVNEGTGNLVTALDMTDVATGAGAPLLNWVTMGIGSVPITVPQTFFARAQDLDLLARRSPPSGPAERLPARACSIVSHVLGVDRDLGVRLGAVVADPATTEAGHGYLEPASARFRRTGRSPVTQPGDRDLTFYPVPVIQRISGEAVEAGVIFPAQYGSPHLFSDGLYWSASVNPTKLGLYRYTLWITLYYARCDRDGRDVDHSVTLAHDGFLKLSVGAPRSGFADAGLVMVAG